MTTPEDKPFSRGVFQGKVLAYMEAQNTRLEKMERTSDGYHRSLTSVVNRMDGDITELKVNLARVEENIPKKKLVTASALGLALTIFGGIGWGIYTVIVGLINNGS